MVFWIYLWSFLGDGTRDSGPFILKFFFFLKVFRKRARPGLGATVFVYGIFRFLVLEGGKSLWLNTKGNTDSG